MGGGTDRRTRSHLCGRNATGYTVTITTSACAEVYYVSVIALVGATAWLCR